MEPDVRQVAAVVGPVGSRLLTIYCVCMDAELVNIFDMFIPQLLRYPNPSDPLNGEAASLLMKDAESYNKKVKGGLRPRACE